MYGLRIAAQDIIAGRVYTIDPNHHTNAGQPGIKMLLYASSKTVDSSITDSNGNYRFLIEGNCNNLRVQPSAEGLPLPQPDSWDAVLIMQHILGIQPFTTRRQFICADLNRSGSITTFDILLLRQWIFDQTKKRTKDFSWHFYDATMQENKNSNFQDGVTPEYRIIDEKMLPEKNLDFAACPPGKIYNLVDNESRLQLSKSGLRIESLRQQADDLLQYCVYFDGPYRALAMQFALQFDPAQMTLIGPSAEINNTCTAANFDLSKVGNGDIGFAWQAVDAEQTALDSGALLFHLFFKVHPGSESPSLKLQTGGTLSAAIWSPSGKKTILQPVYKSSSPDALPDAETLFIRQDYPGRPVTLLISDGHPGKARVVISGAFGERLSLRDIHVEGGPQEILLPETEALKTGVYRWWVKLPYDVICTGEFVKR